MTSQDTYYDGPSVSIGAGTWLIFASVTWDGTGHAFLATAKLWNGTVVAASCQCDTRGVSGDAGSLTLAAIVTTTGTETWKVSVAAHSGGLTLIKAAATFNGAGNNGSTILAVQVG
jgi:hypothetical protein